jgi:hypothetical protein
VGKFGDGYENTGDPDLSKLRAAKDQVHMVRGLDDGKTRLRSRMVQKQITAWAVNRQDSSGGFYRPG